MTFRVGLSFFALPFKRINAIAQNASSTLDGSQRYTFIPKVIALAR
jgi:hypothetical protein